MTHLMVCGEAGRMRAVQAAGHSIETDAEIAVISLKPDGPTAFILRGTVVRLDDRTLTPQTGVWRVQRTEPATAPGG